MSYAVPKMTWTAIWYAIGGFYAGKPTFVEAQYPKLDGKVVIVTGASTGVGYQTAKSLLGSTNARVYIFARNKEKTLAAIDQIKLEVAKEYTKGDLDVHFIETDLSDLSTLKASVDEFLSLENRVDIIIHNAGVMSPPKDSKTAQGYELQLGTNAIGVHLLQKYLDPLFIETSKKNQPGESRIVFVSSTAHYAAPLGGVNHDNPNFVDKDIPSVVQYGQSKALNVIQGIEWKKNHPEAPNAVSVSVCPGYLRTDLQRTSSYWNQVLSYPFLYPARNGAYSELFAALSPDLTPAESGTHVQSFGRIGTIRPDVAEPANSEKGWSFLEGEIKKYI